MMNNFHNINDLIENCLVTTDTPILPDTVKNLYDKKKVVFTGFTTSQKEFMHTIAAHCSMSVQTSVCKSTEFLICGDNAGPSKVQRALAQGITILTAVELFESLNINCPKWVMNTHKNSETTEREKYLLLFQKLPIELLRSLYQQAVTFYKE